VRWEEREKSDRYDCNFSKWTIEEYHRMIAAGMGVAVSVNLTLSI
jgi:hypothetical protein